VSSATFASPERACSTAGEGNDGGQFVARLSGRLVPDDADPTPGHRQSVRGRKMLTTTNEEAPRTSGVRLPEIVVVMATRITQLVAYSIMRAAG
jgi:hypothetical protein